MKEQHSKNNVDSLVEQINSNIASSKEIETSIEKLEVKKKAIYNKVNALRMFIQRRKLEME
ncbi:MULTISPECIES: hypothetical protein [Flammeovirga]|uniref:Uncharacterized protein n=1 Tax=Flammeovirga agarivorans TaxID=2726742 RepID=A0A7X8XUK9_9BACT|nr:MULTISPECIES: hypothetical protein [Flammeovirga]NLR90451.1 hypothetical protein [Flammeovirga agarivorans]